MDEEWVTGRLIDQPWLVKAELILQDPERYFAQVRRERDEEERKTSDSMRGSL